MRFKRPEIGDKRTKTGFAWLPKNVGKEIIWLEKYTMLQVYYGRGWGWIEDGMD